MKYIDPQIEEVFRGEPSFKLFKHEGLICCVQRMSYNGNINGYVAVRFGHPLYGKQYSDKISLEKEPKFNGNYIGLLLSSFEQEHEIGVFSLDMALDVHGGLTYSRDNLLGVDEALFGKLWWFGFDTGHAWDKSPFVDGRLPMFGSPDSEYRNFEYVENETKRLAEQLKKMAEA